MLIFAHTVCRLLFSDLWEGKKCDASGYTSLIEDWVGMQPGGYFRNFWVMWMCCWDPRNPCPIQELAQLNFATLY